MPFLDWYGRKAVENYHQNVPYHLLRYNNQYSVGESGSGNLLVQGDNLTALKALLPYYAGQVKCVYIDPPYNTGTENWVYNDNVNSPEIREWLGKVVGKEAEDLSRHDKWLCMMYPRLQLLRQFLREDGAIFISIDDNEVASLRMIMDEIFGQNNFVATIIWQKVFSPKNSAKHLSTDHDYILLYAKNKEIWRPNLVSRSDKQGKTYKNPDNDPRGPWTSGDLSARNFYSKGTYPITCPSGKIISGPPKGNYWRYAYEDFQQLDADKRIWWGKDGNSTPRIKRFLSEVKQGVVPQTFWPYTEVGHTQEAKQELVSMVEFEDSASVFITPKPTRLIKRILDIATDKDSLILDSFAGSGTTGHAVLSQNADDGGSRKFIMIEIEPQICRSVTGERLRQAITGYVPTKAGKQAIPGLGGSFSYCELGEPLFSPEGRINETVSYEDLAQHLYFVETGEPLQVKAKLDSPLIGVHNGIAIYLLYNGILKDRSVQGGNVLTTRVLEELPPREGTRIIYGASCRIGADRLKRQGIIFKQIPYQVRWS